MSQFYFLVCCPLGKLKSQGHVTWSALKLGRTFRSSTPKLFQTTPEYSCCFIKHFYVFVLLFFFRAADGPNQHLFSPYIQLCSVSQSGLIYSKGLQAVLVWSWTWVYSLGQAEGSEGFLTWTKHGILSILLELVSIISLLLTLSLFMWTHCSRNSFTFILSPAEM